MCSSCVPNICPRWRSSRAPHRHTTWALWVCVYVCRESVCCLWRECVLFIGTRFCVYVFFFYHVEVQRGHWVRVYVCVYVCMCVCLEPLERQGTGVPNVSLIYMCVPRARKRQGTVFFRDSRKMALFFSKKISYLCGLLIQPVKGNDCVCVCVSLCS
jgi:hypothetical protein